jgi:hypothetical protein
MHREREKGSPSDCFHKDFHQLPRVSFLELESAAWKHNASVVLSEFPDLARLSKDKRLKLADDLWLSGMDDKAAVPQWHRETLDERWQNYQNGKANLKPRPW